MAEHESPPVGPTLPSVAEIKAAHPNFRLDVPEFIGTLDDYQHVAVGCMHVAKRFLLMDSVGLGKTVEFIGLLAYHRGLGKPPRWFVVVERAQLFQWAGQIKRFLGVDPIVIRGDMPKAKRVKEYAKLREQESFVALIGYGSLRSDFEEIDQVPDRSFAFDEAAMMCNINQTSVAAGRLIRNSDYGIFITAEPITRGDVTQVYNIFNVMDRKLLPQEEFEEKFVIREFDKVWVKRRGKAVQIETSKVVGVKMENIEELKALMAPYSIRRSDKVIRGGSYQINKQIRTAEMTETQAKLYASLRDSKQTPQMTEDEKKAVVAHVIQSLVAPWVVDQTMEKTSPKADMIVNLLQYEIPGEQLVVFTKYVNSAKLISERLTAEGISNVVVTGEGENADPQVRFNKVQEFSRGEVRVFIMTFAARQGVDGLQTNCRDIVVVDPSWNPDVIVQAIGRLARRGQKHRIVNAYFLGLEGTFEAEIFEKLKTRQTVADAIYDEDKSGLFAQDDYNSILEIM